MLAAKNRSVNNFLKQALKKLKLTDNELNAIRAVLDKAQYDCCNVITVYWVNDTNGGSLSNASPDAYQIQFKDADGNIIVETDVSKSSPQILKVPPGLYQICNNVISTASDGLPGSGFSVENQEALFYTDSDNVAVHCDTVNGLAPLSIAYWVRSFNGNPE